MSNEQIVIRAVLGLAALFGICLGLVFLVGAVSRWQTRADAANRIQVYQRELKTSKLQAAIRFQQSIGLREAQNEIRKTLTPLYVAFEMTQALQAIAQSGRNNSVVYVPTNPTNGLPIVPTSNSLTPAKP